MPLLLPNRIPSGGGITPYAPVSGSWTLTGGVDEEFVGASALGSGDTVSASGLASGSLGIDRKLWTPYYYVEGGDNNGVATHAANIMVASSIATLSLPSTSSGANLYGGTDDGVSGHSGWSDKTFCAEVRAYFVTNGAGTANVNWPCPLYFSSGSWPTTGELDLGEILVADGLAQATITLIYSSGGSETQSQFKLGVLSGWHIISANWSATANTIDCYLDGVLIPGTSPYNGASSGSAAHTFTSSNGVSSSIGPLWPIAVMGTASNSYNGAEQTPSSMQIDWIRIFKPV